MSIATTAVDSPAPPVLGSAISTSRAAAIAVAGLIGLAASVTLTVEKIRLLADPGYVPSCNLNPVLACGSVMVTEQASVLGLPNSLMGIIAFTVVALTGALSVMKVVLPHWYWSALALATAGGVAFVHWLIFQSLYRIGALCPYCMVVWAVTVVLLVIFAALAWESGPLRKNLQLLHRWRWTLTALWFIALFLLIFLRFQDYWLTLV